MIKKYFYFNSTFSTTSLNVESKGKRIENELISIKLARLWTISSVPIVFCNNNRSVVKVSDWISRVNDIFYSKTNTSNTYLFENSLEVKYTFMTKMHCCWQSISNFEHFNCICVSLSSKRWRRNRDDNRWSSKWILRI